MNTEVSATNAAAPLATSAYKTNRIRARKHYGCARSTRAASVRRGRPPCLVNGVPPHPYRSPIAAGVALLVPALLALALHHVVLFASLGPSAVMQAHHPRDRSSRFYSVVVSHLIGFVVGGIVVILLGIQQAPSVFQSGGVSGSRAAAAVISTSPLRRLRSRCARRIPRQDRRRCWSRSARLNQRCSGSASSQWAWSQSPAPERRFAGRARCCGATSDPASVGAVTFSSATVIFSSDRRHPIAHRRPTPTTATVAAASAPNARARRCSVAQSCQLRRRARASNRPCAPQSRVSSTGSQRL